MPSLLFMDQFVEAHTEPDAKYLKNINCNKDTGSIDLRGWVRIR